MSATTGSENEGLILRNVVAQKQSEWGGMGQAGRGDFLGKQALRFERLHFSKHLQYSYKNNGKTCITKIK